MAKPRLGKVGTLCVKNKGVHFDTPSDKSVASLFPRNKD